ncbi:MAG: IMP cyclohydrolase [Clostridia bacterium]|nr:IMP cyclohydrolase [Clostridia bacterium]MBQ8583871.1 IMP cyclohydrolase [Clostridia bacterium]
MNVYEICEIENLLSTNPYPGRGIVIGKSADGKSAVFAYFIMGRSENSRNRVFVEKNDAVYTEPYDFSKVSDPSLIIYAAIRRAAGKLIVTNGDQTDTIYDGITAGGDMRSALRTREFEPDAPNLTPRISGVLDFDGGFSYEMSILKSADAEGTECNRYFYEYKSLDGVGHFIHTYVTDGNPIPTFQGEPERVAIPSDIDEFTSKIWNSLNESNKISLYVRYIDLASGEETSRLINKNK